MQASYTPSSGSYSTGAFHRYSPTGCLPTKGMPFEAASNYNQSKRERIDAMDTLFANTLKKLRTKRDLTQAQLARAMFVNNTTISQWESGSRLPSAHMIARLAGVLKVDVETLLSTAAEIDELPGIIVSA